MPHNGYGLAMWRHIENRQPVTGAKFINKSLLFILLPSVIRRLELKPSNEQKAENIFVDPPYTPMQLLAAAKVVMKQSNNN